MIEDLMSDELCEIYMDTEIGPHHYGNVTMYALDDL
jgi:hypothetical protein